MAADGAGRRFLIVAIPFLLLAFLAGATLGYVVRATPERALKALSERFSARYAREVKLFFELNGITPHSRFVVAELDQTVSGSYESRKAIFGVDLGTTSLEYRVPVRFFYAVDFSGERPISFVTDSSSRLLTVSFPPVDLMAAEPDIGRLERKLTVGWGRLERFSGADVQQAFTANVMHDIRAHADDARVREVVRETARRQLADFVRAYLAHEGLTDGVVEGVVVRFLDEPEGKDLPVFGIDTTEGESRPSMNVH